jgi:hypothetical protein
MAYQKKIEYEISLLAHGKLRRKTVKGEPLNLTIPGNFAIRKVRTVTEEWIVDEVTTGFTFAHADDRNDAIELANQMAARHGEIGFRKAIGRAKTRMDSMEVER